VPNLSRSVAAPDFVRRHDLPQSHKSPHNFNVDLYCPPAIQNA
jgi:hypothetical protein